MTDAFPSPRGQSKPPDQGQCLLLSKLPRELRDLTYTSAFSPGPVLTLAEPETGPHKWTPTHRDPADGALKLCPVLLRNHGGRSSLNQVKWHTSLTGILLVSRQVYTETLEFMYRQTEFHFRTPEISLRCLSITFRPGLDNVRHVMVWWKEWDGGQPSQKYKKLWAQIVNLLPNVESLEVQLCLDFSATRFIPFFDNAIAYQSPLSIERFEATQWVQDMLVFRGLNMLEQSEVKIDVRFEYAITDFDQSDQVADETEYIKFRSWHEALRRSWSAAIDNFIRNRDEPWKVHLEKLDQYWAWSEDPSQPTGLLRDGRDMHKG